jgi:glycosyltransferase involved in cell wall biosynthesis
MRNPTVSFVVPCYKLAHLLPECVNSILLQTYTNFEVLIMDDCSPDNTGGVVQSFADSRIRYIRNDQNLGHLANYNKGIKQSRGRYVWLISADDRLRRPYVLERYVQLMDHHPRVGYVCCPGIGLQDGVETTLLDCGYYGPSDKIFNGRDFIATSLDKGYGLLAPSVMVRKDCYDEISDFPLDMPHQGDMYLWFRWALEYDVAYMCEPMVNYRVHDLNIMNDLIRRGDSVIRDEVTVLWRTKHHCEQKGFRALAGRCEYALSWKYARAAASAIYGGDTYYLYSGMNVTQCDQALRDGASGVEEYKRLRGMFFTSMGNQHWRHGEFRSARQSYLVAVRDNWRMPQVWLKILILFVGLGRTAVSLKKLANRGCAKLTAWRALQPGVASIRKAALALKELSR